MYLDSVEPQPPSLRAEPSQPEGAGPGFWAVRPGGGLEGAATGSALGGRGTFQSSWARDELDTEPPPGDHFDSLGLAAREEKKNKTRLQPAVHFTCWLSVFFLNVSNVLIKNKNTAFKTSMIRRKNPLSAVRFKHLTILHHPLQETEFS